MIASLSMRRDAAMNKPSWLFWVVSLFALLWGAFGIFDFYMTKTGDEEYLKDFPPEMIGWIAEFPMWRVLLWGLGVGAGLIGALLLIMRRGVAVPVLWTGVGALLVGFVGHDLLMADGVKHYGTEGIIASIVIIMITVAIAWYASRAKGHGVLA